MDAWNGFWGWLVSLINGAWVGFQWPHAALLITWIVIANFKEQLATTIGRVNEVGPVKLFNPPAPSQVEPAGTNVLGAGVDAETIETPASTGNRGIPLPPIVFPHTMSVARRNLDLEVDGIQGSELTEYLKSRLSFVRALLDFEWIYLMIFGGQIEFLTFLNQKVGLICSREEAAGLWDIHKAKFEGKLDAWSMDQYINFLFLKELVQQDGQNYMITAKGREFLMWMIQASRSTQKPW
ncbi:winged helix-turn-helix domain-containing protein [Pseudomonas koreensis]|uniref:Winged helix-turn-helix domain-containing protein n=1 Tax=Pseudomonas koreensis TaxID=198620 RepID=A0A9X2XFX0_9PSED|nr:winged helix-turn-helix domain-containing protein [Pseudomonas koreensis]MCU7247963.1 winged helix-turn-helix domain-containing protein [Pseudomonas koreensis]